MLGAPANHVLLSRGAAQSVLWPSWLPGSAPAFAGESPNTDAIINLVGEH